MDKLAKSLLGGMLTVFLPVSLDLTLPWVRCRLRGRGGGRFPSRLESVRRSKGRSGRRWTLRSTVSGKAEELGQGVVIGPPTLVLSMAGPTPGRGRRGIASTPETRRGWVTVASARRWEVTDSLVPQGLEVEVGSCPGQVKA